MINTLNKKYLLQTLNKLNLFTLTADNNCSIKGSEGLKTTVQSSLSFYPENKEEGLEASLQRGGRCYTNISKLLEKVNNLQTLDYNKEIITETYKIEANLHDLKSKEQAKYQASKSGQAATQMSYLPPVKAPLKGVVDIFPLVNVEEGLKFINLYTYLNYLSKFNNKIAKAQYNTYFFNKENNNLLLFNKAIKIITLTFSSMGCLISKPQISVVYSKNNINTAPAIDGESNKKIVIKLFYYVRFRKNLNTLLKYKLRTPNLNSKYNSNLSYPAYLNKNLYQRYQEKFDILIAYLNTLLKCEIELDLIRLNKPYYNSNILVQYLALQSYKNRFVRLVSRLFRKMNIYYNKTQNLNNLSELNNINSLINKISNPLLFNDKAESFPSFVSGLHIRMAGRTFKQKIIPRMTVKQIQKGVLSNEKVKLIEKSRFTGKTKRGSYSFTVTLGHIL